MADGKSKKTKKKSQKILGAFAVGDSLFSLFGFRVLGQIKFHGAIENMKSYSTQPNEVKILLALAK